jgi:DNA-binding transcriptional LysR family regulator
MNEPDLSQFDLNLLTVFEVLFHERHVGRTAARLHLTQPAVSHTLNRLRKLLNDPLFVKNPKGIEPTVKAKELAEPIKNVLRQIQSIIAPDSSFDLSSLKRTINIGATDYANFVLLPQILTTVWEKAPQLNIRVYPIYRDMIVPALDKGELDIIFGILPNLPKRIKSFPLFFERLVCISRQNHPKLVKGLSLNTFIELPHLLVSLGGSYISSPVDSYLSMLGHKRRIALTVPHFLSVPFIIEHSDLIATLGERVAKRLSKIAKLDIYQPPLKLEPWAISLLRHQEFLQDPALTWFSNIVISSVAETNTFADLPSVNTKVERDEYDLNL